MLVYGRNRTLKAAATLKDISNFKRSFERRYGRGTRTDNEHSSIHLLLNPLVRRQSFRARSRTDSSIPCTV
jgi:hypothetical protein